MHTIASLNYPRPLQAKRFGYAAPSHVIFGIVFFLLFAAGIFWWQSIAIKDILQDKNMQASAVEVDASFDSKSKCESQYGVLTSCTVYMNWQGTEHKKSFYFFDFHSGDYSATPLASPEFPGQLTLDLAIDKIPSRFAVSGLICLFGVLFLGMACYGIFRRLPLVGKTLSALNQADNQPWQLVALPVNDKGNAFQWQGKKITFAFGKKKTPWFVQGADNRPYVLAIAPKNGGMPAPLDSELSVIGGIDKNERSQLRQNVQMQVLTAQTQGQW